MTDTTPCPECQSLYPYQQAELWICPECNHEWSLDSASSSDTSPPGAILDANGSELFDGDDVTVIKTLKVKGASSSIKAGTKVKKIRLIPDSADDHNIACKIDGMGSINLKSQYVKKS